MSSAPELIRPPFRIERANADDMNFIRSAWFCDVRACYRDGCDGYADLEPLIRDAILGELGAYVLRPERTPPDTVGAYLVADLGTREGVVHWAGTKRSWRGMGFGTAMLDYAQGGGRAMRFTRFAGLRQKRHVEARGWKYTPHLAWCGMEMLRCE